MLDTYRQLASTRRWDWGNDWSLIPFYAVELIPCTVPVPLSRALFGKKELLMAALGQISAEEAIYRCVGSDPPRGVSVIDLERDEMLVATGQPTSCLRGVASEHVVVVRGRRTEPAVIRHDRGSERVSQNGFSVLSVANGSDGRASVLVDDVELNLTDTVRYFDPATLVTGADIPTRWSVADSFGGGWFPEGALLKWDTQFRPFFHGCRCELVVPATGLDVSAARGIEWGWDSKHVTPRPGDHLEVSLAPKRLFTPTDNGWFSADLHVHMNYSGDLVATPEHAACMQAGEGLNVMNLVAANAFRSLVYDKEAFESTVGTDLPWSNEKTIARFGVEYRNDLYGHIHGFGLTSHPARYNSGHGPDGEDWPANDLSCEEFHNLGSLVGYCHPLWSDIPDDGDIEMLFGGTWRGARSVEARELVIDAALGLVDSVDVLSPGNNRGSAYLYQRLLSCGLKLAVTAGTDSFLSFSHGLASDPPGWARVYCRVDGALTVGSIQAAIRRGATIGTNGPWVEIDIGGKGPGDSVDVTPGDTILVRARAHSNGVERLAIVSPDGELAACEGRNTVLEIEARIQVNRSAWFAAIATGGSHPTVLQGTAFAHTSPLYAIVNRFDVAEPSAASWCMRWVDRFERLIREHGKYQSDVHRDDVLDLVARARKYYAPIAALDAPTEPGTRLIGLGPEMQ